MSNRKIKLLATSVIILFALAIGVFIFIKPRHTITVAIDKDAATVTFLNDAKQEVAKTKGRGVVQLPNGTYSANISSDTNSITKKTIPITVKDKNQTITIRTTYSPSYIAAIMSQERNKINTVLFTKYPSLKTDYSFHKESILGNHSDWYVVSFQEQAEEKNSGDIYTIIMKKENNSWTIKTRPQIINTKFNTSDIPDDILSQAFDATSSFSEA